MTLKTTTRQDIWQAAVAILSNKLPMEEARRTATEIVDLYSSKRQELSQSHRVPEETRHTVKRLLLSRSMGIGKIAKECGVGTSTVQLLADELKLQGLLV